MIKPIADLILTPEQSRYSLVIAISKRARQISEEAEKKREILDEKPVELAVQEYCDHKVRMIEKVKTDDEENS